tara:strand:+ start:1592 stop:2239 length:648 start_codon:yes stop_codon:yes gene_type:complete
MAATKGGFWTDSTTQDPKRNYRFLVSIGNMDNGAQWFAKGVSRPSFTVEKTEHMFLNHTFKYPTRTKWDDITVTLVDPVTPDAVNQTMQIIKASGYDPSILTSADYGTTATKAASVGALGSVTISMVDGVHTGDTSLPFLEKWTLNAPFITGVKLSDLAYDNDDLATIELTFAYDWASCEVRSENQIEVAVNSGSEAEDMLAQDSRGFTNVVFKP